jgi:hypothetical protein
MERPLLVVTVGARTTEIPRARALARDALRHARRAEHHVIDVSIVLSELLQTAAEEGEVVDDLEVRLLDTRTGTRIEIEDHLVPVVALGGRHHALRSDVLAALTTAQGSYSTPSGRTVVWAEVPASRLSAVGR